MSWASKNEWDFITCVRRKRNSFQLEERDKKDNPGQKCIPLLETMQELQRVFVFRALGMVWNEARKAREFKNSTLRN